MSKQLTLDEIKLPDLEDSYNVDVDEFENHSKSAKVVCGECGAGMKRMGPDRTYRTTDREVDGVWMYSCRQGRHGSALLFVYKNGRGVLSDEKGQNHNIVESEMKHMNDVGPVHEPFLDPSLWEESED